MKCSWLAVTMKTTSAVISTKLWNHDKEDCFVLSFLFPPSSTVPGYLVNAQYVFVFIFQCVCMWIFPPRASGHLICHDLFTD